MNAKHQLGQRVVRWQGRPSNVGRIGVITWISGDVIGGAGDILVTVTQDNGSTFQCYDRQLRRAA
jgi:hypothetical protein